MNAYQQACLVEQRGMAALLPFLESRAWRGQVIQVAKGPLARHFQRSFGDLLLATGPGAVASVEIKTCLLAQPDVCVAMTITGNVVVALRAAATGVELRVMHKAWSLPAGAAGMMHVAIGSWQTDLQAAGINDNTLSAELDAGDVEPLLQNAAKASLMGLTVGKEKPFTVSLAGSAKVLNAFRTCAGISGGDAQGGENPFR